MKSIVSVVGARPQFVKLAPVSRAFSSAGKYEHLIVHTGQHYDHDMSAVFFDELEIPTPDVDLNVGSGSHGTQTAAMLSALEIEFHRISPNAVVVYGDTNSTLAATLAASKMHIPLMHVEAGLRSFNRLMPEEINRLVADHCSDRLYVPTTAGMSNLEREGLADRALLTGDVMLDALQFNSRLADNKSDVLEKFGLLDSSYAVATIHRPVNTEPEFLKQLLLSLDRISSQYLPIVLPMHPRTRAILGEDISDLNASLIVSEPLPYIDMLRLIGTASVVMTDSGGLQKEAAFLGTPCITLREETEWTETLDMGANVLVGQDLPAMEREIARALDDSREDWSGAIGAHYGDGDAANRIVADILRWCDDGKKAGINR